MKNMKKLFCALLVVATVVCFMPTMAFADSDTGRTTTGGTTTGGTTTGGATTGGTGPSYPIIISPGTPTNPTTPTEPEEVDVKGQIDKIDLVARSVKGSVQGKKAIKVYWYEKDGDDLSVLDGYEVFRSTKRYSGYGTKAFFKTERTKYWNTTIESGVKYYYKVRGFAEVNGEKLYTNWSLKAWRIA